jgi:hypothetical protein
MDQYSILDRNSSGLADEADGSPVRAAQVRPATISAQIAAANAVLSRSSDAALRFPGEDYGRSLAQMAHADLDATLQLLADRAQYITGASGAAIAAPDGMLPSPARCFPWITDSRAKASALVNSCAVTMPSTIPA